MKDVMEEIERSKKIIHIEYDIIASEIKQIVHSSSDYSNAVCNGFLLGYLRGINAKKNNLNIEKTKTR